MDKPEVQKRRVHKAIAVGGEEIQPNDADGNAAHDGRCIKRQRKGVSAGKLIDDPCKEKRGQKADRPGNQREPQGVAERLQEQVIVCEQFHIVRKSRGTHGLHNVIVRQAQHDTPHNRDDDESQKQQGER